MKKIAGHKFKKNGAGVAVYAVDEKMKGVPIGDTLCLEFTIADKEGHHKNRIFMRPDEAIQIASFLTDAVYKTTSAYRFGLLKK